MKRIEDCSDVELKSFIYDNLIQSQALQKEINFLEQELVRRQQLQQQQQKSAQEKTAPVLVAEQENI